MKKRSLKDSWFVNKVSAGSEENVFDDNKKSLEGFYGKDEDENDHGDDIVDYDIKEKEGFGMFSKKLNRKRRKVKNNMGATKKHRNEDGGSYDDDYGHDENKELG